MYRRTDLHEFEIEYKVIASERVSVRGRKNSIDQNCYVKCRSKINKKKNKIKKNLYGRVIGRSYH